MENVVESTKPSHEEHIRKRSCKRRITEKGLDYRKQLLERDCNLALKIWKDQSRQQGHWFQPRMM